MNGGRRDGGFTLVELMLAITLLGLISGPIIGAIFVVLQSSSVTLSRSTGTRGTAQDQVTTSQEQRLLDAAFTTDVQSSQVVTTTKPACPVAVGGAVISSVAGFDWPDSSGGAVTRRSSAWYYLARPVLSGVTPDLTKLGVLHRATCRASLTSPGVALSGTARDVIISRSVGPVAPSLTCADGAALPCSSGSRVVTLRVKLALDSTVDVGVQAQRRLP